MKVAVFHPGTQHSWQTATAVQQLGRLEWYATSIFHRPERFPYALAPVLPGRLRRMAEREFARFAHPALDPALVRTMGAYEWLERFARRSGAERLAQAFDRKGNRSFASGMEKLVAQDRPFALWGFDGVSGDVFAQPAARDRLRILDRTTPDMRALRPILADLRERYGDWFTPEAEHVTQTRIDQDESEYELADVIVVGSEYAATTIREHSSSETAAKVRVLPYCYDETLFGNQPAPRRIAPDEPVRFLFSGRAWPAKGIQHALEAIASLPRGQARLTVVGHFNVPASTLGRFEEHFDHVPQVPRAEMPALMASHHVLLFPSYFEGAGLTLLEAMASGMALIQGPNAFHAVSESTGIMLEKPDSDLLREAMLALISDRERLQAMRQQAQIDAAAHDFAHYRDNIAALLAKFAV